MPRLNATYPEPELPSSPPRARPNARRRKAAPLPDRLSAQQLLWRRLKRAGKPLFWLLVAGAAVVGGHSLLREVPRPSTPDISAPQLGGVLGEMGLRVNKIIINGAPATDLPDLQAAIAVQPGDPLFGVSLAGIQGRVDQLGPVESAIVQRQLPGTLVVTVQERNAAAIWQTVTNGTTQFVVVDNNGNTIPGQDAAAAKRREPWLLLITGPGAPAQAQALLALLKAQPVVNAHVVAAEWVDQLRWNLILKNHAVVKLPTDNVNAALAQLTALQTSLQLLDRPVEALDMRLPGKLVVEPYPPPPAPPKTETKP